MSWMQRGYDAGDKAREAEKARRGGGDKTRRHWMPSGKTMSMTFLDGENPAVYREHNLYINRHRRNWFTCIQGMKDADGTPIRCPICAAGNKSYAAFAYTIIDHSSWKDSKGNVHENEVRLLVVKDEVFALLKRQNEKRKGLTGCVFEVTRGEASTSPNTGDHFDFEEKVDLAVEWPDASPVDYEKELEPMSVEALSGIYVDTRTYDQTLADKQRGGGGGGGGGGHSYGKGSAPEKDTRDLPDDIPF